MVCFSYIPFRFVTLGYHELTYLFLIFTPLLIIQPFKAEEKEIIEKWKNVNQIGPLLNPATECENNLIKKIINGLKLQIIAMNKDLTELEVVITTF